MTRPGKDEINAWQGMLGDMDGADNWGWDSFYAAMKKSEAFDAPSDAIAKQANISWDSSTRGTNGPIHVSYPGLCAQPAPFISPTSDLSIVYSTKLGNGRLL